MTHSTFEYHPNRCMYFELLEKSSPYNFEIATRETTLFQTAYDNLSLRFNDTFIIDTLPPLRHISFVCQNL